MVWGLSSVGFKAKDFETIKGDAEDALKSELDPSMHFGPGSVAGVLTGIIANQARQTWEALDGLYHSLRPSSATGRALDALCSLTGTYRRRATHSRAKASMTLDANTTLPARSRVKSIAGEYFLTAEEIKNEGRRAAVVPVDLIAETTGAVLAHKNTEAEIMTPSAGWISATLVGNSEMGRDDESDDDLRARRLFELKAVGSSTLETVRARLMQLDGVESVDIDEYDHYFKAVIMGGDDQEIAQTIWQSKPLGVRTDGKKRFIIEDELKIKREVRFSRPKAIPLSIHLKLKVQPGFSLNDIAHPIVTFAKSYFKLATPVYASHFSAVILDCDNVLDVVWIELLEGSNPERKPVRSQFKSDEIATLDNISDVFIRALEEVR